MCYTETPIVGEGCSPLGRRHEVTVGEASPPRNAPPDTYPINVTQGEAYQVFRRVRRLPTYRNLSNICHLNNQHISFSVVMTIGHPQNDGSSVIESVR